MISVLLVDDHALVRSGFAMALGGEDDLRVVGQAADGAEAVELAARERPDVVLMDVQMPVMDGLEATRRICAAGASRVIILTTFDRDDYLFEALRSGASGFLLKNADPDALIDAVRAVAGGQALLAPEATVRVIRRLVGTSTETQRMLEQLTEREAEVLVLMADGLSNREIAQRLFVGEATVKTHVSNVLAKTGSRDRVQAVVLAHRTGLAGRG